MLLSAPSAGDKDPRETVIDTRNGAIENADVSSRNSATQGSKKEPSIANSWSSRGRQIDESELENLRAKKETEQRLRQRQMELEQEREEMELCRRNEKREQELGLKLQQQEDELRLWEQEQALEKERKKAEADEQQRRVEFELTEKKFKSVWFIGRQLKKCWIKTQSRRNCKLVKVSGPKVWP